MRMSFYGYEAEELYYDLIDQHQLLAKQILKQGNYPDASFYIGRAQARLHMAEEVRRILSQVSSKDVLRYYKRYGMKFEYDRLAERPYIKYISPVTLQKIAESLRDSCYSDASAGSRSPYPGSKENLGYLHEIGQVIAEFSVRPKKLG